MRRKPIWTRGSSGKDVRDRVRYGVPVLARARSFWLVLLATGIGVAAPAAAQEAVPATSKSDGKQIFQPTFFASFSPLSALDMVARIPGFSINYGDGRRGFGENAGNVLIDGDRPSTKSDDIGTILSRIPASQVAYIVLSEAAGSDADARGQGQVVNVVRKISNALSGKYEIDLELGAKRGATPFGDISATLRRGPTTYDLSASYYAQLNHNRALEIERTGQGVVTGRRAEVGRNIYSEAVMAGAVKTKAGTAKINLNGKLKWQRYTGDLSTIVFAPDGTLVSGEVLRQQSPKSDVTIELGGDIALPLTRTLGTKIVGLYRAETSNGAGSVITTRPRTPPDRFDTADRSAPTEAILRLQNDWSAISGHAIQFGGELAYNRLAARFAATSTVDGAVTQFPASNVVVTEQRFEPFVSDVWTISKKWTLESGVIVEASRLTLAGDSRARRSFVFAKPRLVASWAAGPRTNFEFRAERQVAQLDFGAFATSVDLGAGAQVSAGNADLVPEKTLTFSAEVRRTFFDRGSIKLTGRYVRVSDTQDLVPVIVRNAGGVITSRFDGAGNIGNSTRWNAALEITLPFDWITRPLGITGMELKYTGHYTDSRVTDPVTGRIRRRSNDALWDQNFDFHQDLPKAGISWGAQIYVQSPQSEYFIDQIRTVAQGADVFAYFEYKKWSFGTVRFQISNVTDLALIRARTFFRESRATDDVIRTFVRERRRDSRLQVSLTRKF